MGKNPAFCYISGGGFTYQIQFDGNDGGGIGGLTARAGNGNVGSGSFADQYTYSGILGNADSWHHYAVVWDIDGVPGSGNTIEIYLDGKLYSSNARYNPTELTAPTDGQLYIPLIYSSYNGSVAIDELKIWNYAKIHFVIPEPGIIIGWILVGLVMVRRRG